MKFPFGNKIPFITIVEDKGKKVVDVIIGIPGDTEYTFHADHKKGGYVFFKGIETRSKNYFYRYK